MDYKSLAISSTLLFNIGVDSFSFIAISILLLSTKRLHSNSYGQRLFRNTQSTLCAVLISDMLTWILDGTPGTVGTFMVYIVNMLFFFFVPLATYTWFQYAWYRVYKMSFPKKLHLWLITLPFIILTAISISSPWTKLIFYVDDSNVYHRGPLNNVFALIFLGFTLWSSLFSLNKYRKSVIKSDKQEFLTISSFIIAPLVGGIIQIFVYGCSLTWPCTAFSMLLVFLNIQDREISQDSLTGLNNRATLDRYLQSLFDSEKKNQISLIIFDMNSFKSINDNYGHLNGDEALIQFASIMKLSFNGTNFFLARYGGDEFVAILRDVDATRTQMEITRIKNALLNFNTTKKFEFSLSVSAGYCMYPAENIISPQQLIEAADEKMYIEKQEYHRQHIA